VLGCFAALAFCRFASLAFFFAGLPAFRASFTRPTATAMTRPARERQKTRTTTSTFSFWRHDVYQNDSGWIPFGATEHKSHYYYRRRRVLLYYRRRRVLLLITSGFSRFIIFSSNAMGFYDQIYKMQINPYLCTVKKLEKMLFNMPTAPDQRFHRS